MRLLFFSGRSRLGVYVSSPLRARGFPLRFVGILLTLFSLSVLLWCAVGNPQQLGQLPIKFNRSVLSLLLSPDLMEHESAHLLFKEDAIARARELLGYFGGAPGAYTDSRGAIGIRKEVARFIAERDGTAEPSLSELFLTDGASVGVRYALTALLRDANDAILTPIPQYPLYSAIIQAQGGQLMPYYLHEAKGWTPDYDEIRAALARARAEGTSVRAIAFINPGNPTGTIMGEEDVKALLQFAYDERLVVLADEVYQPNVYHPDKPFVSAHKALASMPEPVRSGLELVSFHTVSKGVLGECGLRGGYMHLTNVHEGAVDELYKTASINLCPNTIGQACVSLLVKKPKKGDASYDETHEQLRGLLRSLAKRAHQVADAFQALPGMSCTPTEGAMYSFPQLHIPPKAIEEAKRQGKEPDVLYCLELLEATGIVTVPGSGFGQEPGTYHFRTTILPQEEDIDNFCQAFKKFHLAFLEKYQ